MGAIPVLLVCGHADTADLYKSALEHGGVGTRVAPTTTEALALMQEEYAAAVVVVIGPADDPVEIGRAFRERAGSAAAALVALSSVQHSRETLGRLLEAFDEAMLIPCTPDVLMRKIATITKQKRRTGS